MPISNSEIKMVRALGTKKFRDESGLFVVEGEKMVAEALSSGFEPVHLWKRDDIGEEAMSRISSLSSPSPVLAVLRQRPAEEPEIKDALYLGLDSVRDPGNMGTILRLCDWFGAEGVFASRDSVELYNPKVVQATMGAIFRKKVWYCDLPEVCAHFRARGLKVYGTFLDGADIYREELAAGGLVIMGNEARGISAPVAAEVDSRLYIPSFSEGPGAESLNVAVATAVCLSEFKRRTH